MKKKLAVTAIALGMTLTASAGVYAGSNLQDIRASLNYGLGIVVNGKAYTPKDGNGKTLAPITYNGTTYLPVRSVGEALGTSVTYDAKNSKVLIGGSSSSGGTTSPGTSTVQRPQNLPADFPLPSDAKVYDVIEGSAAGQKSVTFSYLTKQDLESLGNTYKQYFAKKGATSKSEQVSASSFTIIDAGSAFSVTLDGAPGTGSNKGYNRIDVIWSGK
ncbi:stalk domain-containing protein [Saccharibacillus sp. CPCC 101409]|uniref:stalk domain-containing protein n=1 Tax=Saccharibacillus sp. CPCC 101409 TaxID=3058041 RepID=UPI00267142AD|nr:stalk domain-containing protein [Saccharibacillus sp. CPCC 101409]MDO3408236.1 stalk domain-containing protein [Saccharibacillus sp. CPCC 101409]